MHVMHKLHSQKGENSGRTYCRELTCGEIWPAGIFSRYACVAAATRWQEKTKGNEGNEEMINDVCSLPPSLPWFPSVQFFVDRRRPPVGQFLVAKLRYAISEIRDPCPLLTARLEATKSY